MPECLLCQIHVDKSCGCSPCSRKLAMIWCPYLFVVTIKVRSLSDQTQSKNGGQNTLTFGITIYANALEMAKYLSTSSLAMRIQLTYSQRTFAPLTFSTSGSILELSSLMTNPAPRRQQDLRGGVRTYSPLLTNRSCDLSHNRLLRLPRVA